MGFDERGKVSGDNEGDDGGALVECSWPEGVVPPVFTDFSGKQWESSYPVLLGRYYDAVMAVGRGGLWGVHDGAHDGCIGDVSVDLRGGGQVGVDRSSSGGGDSHGVERGECASRQRALLLDVVRTDGAAVVEESVCLGGVVGEEVVVPPVVKGLPRGRNYEKNQAARLRRKKAKEMAGSWRKVPRSVPSLAGSSGVETVVTTASEAEAAAELSAKLKESLARRRLAENEVATLKAERLAKSLKDEEKCRVYDQLKECRLMQWTNQAKSGSQKSWKECAESGGIVSSAGSAGEYHFKKALNDMTLRVKPRADAFDAVALDLQRLINAMEEGEAKKDARFRLDSLLKSVDKEVERLEAELSAGDGLRCHTPCVDDYDSEGNFIEDGLFY